MLDQAKKIAAELRDKLIAYDDFIGLYLYGSCVNGKPNKDSDIDILALFANDKNDDRAPLIDAWNLEINNDVVIDFHTYTPQEFTINQLYYENVKRGIYYAR